MLGRFLCLWVLLVYYAGIGRGVRTVVNCNYYPGIRGQVRGHVDVHLNVARVVAEVGDLFKGSCSWD